MRTVESILAKRRAFRICHDDAVMALIGLGEEWADAEDMVHEATLEGFGVLDMVEEVERKTDG